MAQAEHLPQEKEDILMRLCDSLECSICLEQYTDPRVLNCQHSFCAKCLKQHVGVSDILRCPLCNNESAKPAEGIDSLQSNFFIKGLIEDVIGKKTELQEELKPTSKCGSCEEGNDAISHCEECQSDVCADCMDMHKKMKALKDHKVTPLPTQEELLEEVKIKSDDMIEKIAHDIYDEEAELNEKISSLKNRIGEIEKERDTERNKLRESHRQLLENIDDYVQQLSTTINSSAAERLGDMPQELAACEQKQKTYKTLKQQGWIIRNIQIDKRIQRCQELMKQLSDFQQRSHASVYHGGNDDVVAPEFVEGVADQSQVLFGLVRCLGYLRPITSRLHRTVEIRRELNMAADMKHSLVEAMHDALDHIGKNPTTKDSLDALRDWMHNHMKKKYPEQQKGSTVIVGYDGGYSYQVRSHSLLEVVIDDVKFNLFKRQ